MFICLMGLIPLETKLNSCGQDSHLKDLKSSVADAVAQRLGETCKVQVALFPGSRVVACLTSLRIQHYECRTHSRL